MRHIALVIADRPMASSGGGLWFILSPGRAVQLHHAANEPRAAAT